MINMRHSNRQSCLVFVVYCLSYLMFVTDREREGSVPFVHNPMNLREYEGKLLAREGRSPVTGKYFNMNLAFIFTQPRQKLGVSNVENICAKYF